MPSPALENGRTVDPSFHAPPLESTPLIPFLHNGHINLASSLIDSGTHHQRIGIELPVQPAPKASYKEVDARKGAFTVEQRFQVRYEQEFLCAACGKSCRGEHFGEPILAIHHIVPLKQHGNSDRENALGLCPDDHKIFDYLALEYNLFPIPVTEAREGSTALVQKTPRPFRRHRRERPQIDLGHKRLRKGKKIKTPREIKRHQERIQRNQKLPPTIPPQADVFTQNMLGAD